MEYYFPELMLEYQYAIPMTHWGEIIFYYEAAIVTASILHKLKEPQGQLVIYSDSQNSVNIWQSLKASDNYNGLLWMAIDSRLVNNLNMHVLHVLGSNILVTDALSHRNNAYVSHLDPNLQIHTFQPPLGLLEAAKTIAHFSSLPRQPVQQAWMIERLDSKLVINLG